MANLIPLISLAFIFINFIIYIFYYRNIKIGRTEKGIFLFQVISLLILTGWTFWAASDYTLDKFITSIFFVISLHGIYSLSFLEIWALSEGGYSLQILKIISKNDGVLPKKSFESLVEVGDFKKLKRIESLKKMGLVMVDQDIIRLTRIGYVASCVVNYFRLLTNVKNAG